MKRVAFETVDVFAQQRFGGNPLAVMTDARGLSAAEMQAVAREFNYSESTFVLPPADSANTARVRIFTPTNEVPFAGHPNVGTAFVLGRLASIFGRATSDVMRFEEDAGIVEVSLTRRDGEVTGARIRAPRTLELGEEIAPATIAACVSLDAGDVAIERHRPVAASVGLPFAVAELRSIKALERAAFDTPAFHEAERRHRNDDDRFSLFVYVRMGEGRVRARMFAPLSKTPEDPATGSASGALAGLLARLSGAEAAFQVMIEQGVEMGRPSVIEASVENGRIFVSGACVPVMHGMLMI
jgi:trans-2,3-dihydro-3-hydroxyanthranilate isomerase